MLANGAYSVHSDKQRQPQVGLLEFCLHPLTVVPLLLCRFKRNGKKLSPSTSIIWRFMVGETGTVAAGTVRTTQQQLGQAAGVPQSAQ